MTTREEHHDLSLMLLVGRSLSTGLPWDVDRDRALIARERVLWAAMTDTDRAREQAFLVDLWRGRGARRQVSVNRAWGSWTEGLSGDIVIPDAAFGLPRDTFRPVAVIAEGPPIVTWMWSRGFRVVNVAAGVVTLAIPTSRLVAEADRLLILLTSAFGHSDQIGPHGGSQPITLRSCYDPVTGMSVLEVFGLNHDKPTPLHRLL